MVYPVAGEKTLRNLVAEYKSSGPAYRRTVQTTLRTSYTRHYRRGLIRLLEVLEFRTGSSAGQPVIDALALIRRHATAGNLTYYPARENVPAHGGITEDWKPLVYRTDQHGRQRVVRMAYEVVTFQALREHLRCKEIWITGADRWRDPDEDLPADFEIRRAEHYASLRKPLDPAMFITGNPLTGSVHASRGLPILHRESGYALTFTAVVNRDPVCITAGRGRPSREGITLA